MRSGEMFVKVVCHPPLGSETVVAEDEVLVRVAIEVGRERESGWELGLWYGAELKRSEWKDGELVRCEEDDIVSFFYGVTGFS